MKLALSHNANQGYGPDQVKGMTLRDLLTAVQEAIDEHGEDAEIVTKDNGNRYGANWGTLDSYGDLFTPTETNTCDECGSELDDEGLCDNHDDEEL